MYLYSCRNWIQYAYITPLRGIDLLAAMGALIPAQQVLNHSLFPMRFLEQQSPNSITSQLTSPGIAHDNFFLVITCRSRSQKHQKEEVDAKEHRIGISCLF
ncbi:uncharacterized protein L203_105022 [Cryptococcus depauperatus CBS 7841]|uniref:Uncharacterized protein n=1 Tax=Cryptococcus depauperatus CBS 7841 TaxID=1295531 RepID=A0AAJ8M3J8_9TREE